jgi:hypothetical protein
MTPDLILPLIARWVHIFCAVIVIGSIIFYRFAVVVAEKRTLPEGLPEEFKTALYKRWKLLLHPPIIFFLASGLYTYLMVTRHLHDDQPLYHALFGVKFLLALLVFALYVVLTSTMKWSESLRKKDALWAVLILAVLAVMAIGGVMRTLPVVPVVEAHWSNN